nr:hypothetical protein [Bacteroides fragilis]
MATGSTKDNYLANGEKFLDALNIANTGSQQLEYKHEIYNSFDVTIRGVKLHLLLRIIKMLRQMS